MKKNFKMGAAFKRIMALALAIVLVAGYFPMGVSAASGDYTVAGTFNGWSTTATPMTDNRNGTYTVTLPLTAGYYEFKVTNGTWDKSWGGTGPDGNYALTVVKDCDVTFKYLVSGEKASVIVDDKVTVYFDNTANWTDVYAYGWSDSAYHLGAWPGTKMTKVTDNIWSIQIPAADASNIIFHNASGIQTGNLSVPYDGRLVYTYSTNSWSACASSHNWSNGSCTICGAACGHDAHGTDGNCVACGTSVGHSYDSTGACSCGASCAHDSHGTDGNCTSCGKTANVSVTYNGVTKYYDTVSDALATLNGSNAGAVVTLLNDVTGDNLGVDQYAQYTLELNGYTLTADTLHSPSANGITIQDSSAAKTGTVDAEVWIVGPSYIKSGTFKQSVQVTTSANVVGKLTVEGGTFTAATDFLVADDNCTLTLQGGSFPGGILLGRNGDATSIDLTDLVSGDYKYMQSGVAAPLTDGLMEITGDVVVLSHAAHSFDASGYCAGCGGQAIASVTRNGTTNYHFTEYYLEQELHAGMADCTIQLLKDFSCETFDIACGCVLDLNGHTLTATQDVLIALSAESTITDTSAEKNGKIVGKIGAGTTTTLASGTIEGTVCFSSISGTYNAFYMQGGAIDAEIDFYNYDDESFTIQLTGGTFPGGIKVKNYYSEDPITLADCIPSGYAYFLDGNVVTLTEGQTEITGGDVTVAAYVAHTHTYTNGFCESVEGETHYEPAQLNADGVYEIGNAGQLYWFADKVNNDNANFGAADAVLTADITVNEGQVTETGTYRDWTPIGYHADNNEVVYTGAFDGNGKTVSGLYFNYGGAYNVGLIGGLVEGGTVKNVTVANSYFRGYSDVGGIVGSTWGGAGITGCRSSATVAGEEYVGGIVGGNYGTPITDCHNTGSVSSSTYVGGIAGFNTNDAVVTLCSNTGSVSGEFENAGGIVGDNKATVTNCYNTGSVSGDRYVGGIVGRNKSTVTNCYNTGFVSGSSYVGGVNGKQDSSAQTTGCYYLTGTATGGINGGDVAGSAEVKTDYQFTSGQVTYLLNNKSSTDTVVWKQTLNGTNYPTFTGDIVYYAVVDCVGNKDYSNSGGDQLTHNYDENGFCANIKSDSTPCGAYEVPEGEGTEASPYLIDNAGKLFWFAAVVNGGYEDTQGNSAAWAKVTEEITIPEGMTWTPISGYTGTFDGGSKTISGMHCTSDATYVGMFSRTGKCTIQNVCLSNSSFESTNVRGSVGAIAGYAGESEGNSTVISGCSVSDTTVTGYTAGGIAGTLYGFSEISSSDPNCTVNAEGEGGGAVGRCHSGSEIQWVSAMGTVTGNYAGGVVGYVVNDAGPYESRSNDVLLSTFTGSVGSENTTYAGGIIGFVSDGTKASINNCSVKGSVTAKYAVTSRACGLLGHSNNDTTGAVTVSNSFTVDTTLGVANINKASLASGGVTVTNCYSDDSTNPLVVSGYTTDCAVKTDEQFASGEVAYLLDAPQSTHVWGQNIDNGNMNYGFPVRGQHKVYQVVADCLGSVGYSNTESTGTPPHNYVNGFCANEAEGVVCDAYEPATLVTDENYTELGLSADYIGYYAITNAGQLYWFAEKVDNENDTYKAANVVLTADITVNTGTMDANTTGAREWNPIGYCVSGRDYAAFNGTFDGNNKKISGLYFNNTESTTGRKVALIAEAESGALVKNVTVTNTWFHGYDQVAGIVGDNAGTITGCVSEASLSCTWSYIGGVAGWNEGTITGCINRGTIVGKYNNSGGIAGHNAGTVELCGNEGNISNDWCYAGGIAGNNAGIIRNCWNTGEIYVTNSIAGGIAGMNNPDDLVENCWSTGAVSCGSDPESAGGIVGQSEDATQRNCYSLMDPVGMIEDDGGVSTVENMDQITREQLASGEVAYLLRIRAAEGTDVWGQNIDNDQTKQDVPALNGADVYYGYFNCASTEAKLTNTAVSATPVAHDYDNGFCANELTDGTVCDAYEPAVLVTAENREELGLAESYIGYYAIGNAGQLYWFADSVDNENATYGSVNVVLTKDITVNEGTVTASSTGMRDWNPIGWFSTTSDDRAAFSGTFDGNGKRVSGLYFNNIEIDGVSLVAITGETALVKNVTVTNSYFCVGYNSSAVVAINLGTVSGCFNEATLKGDSQIGGIVGRNLGLVELCGNTGAIAGGMTSIGGIVGDNKSTVRNCWNTGNIQADFNYVGGITGANNCSDGAVALTENCWSTGTVVSFGRTTAGGIVGAGWWNRGGVRNCYSLMKPVGGTWNGHPITNAEAVTLDQFASGEVAYLLRTRAAEGTDVWGQNIDNGQTVQNVPALNGADVYQIAVDCAGSLGYSNTNASKAVHNYDDNGFCTNENAEGGLCDAYEPAVPVTEDNYTELDLTADYVGYYAISNAGQLYWFADKVDNEHDTYGSVNVVLTDNITVNAGTVTAESTGMRAWTPIGDRDHQYGGTFDGNGKTISGLYYNDNGNDNSRYVALISCMAESGVVKNVTVTNSVFIGYEFTAAIVGFNDGTVTGCVNNAPISGATYSAGIAANNRGTVELCGNTGTVHASWAVSGGVVARSLSNGPAQAAMVQNCWNTGGISSVDHIAGGIVGESSAQTNSNAYARVQNSWSTGSVSAPEAAGGVTGDNWRARVSNCYSLMAPVGVLEQGAYTDKAEQKTDAQFASGEVAYLLGGIWGQDLDNGKTPQTVPTFDGADVYYGYFNCGETEPKYTNNANISTDPQEHNYDDNGFCEAVEGETHYEPAILVTSDHYAELGLTADYVGYYAISNAGNLYWFTDKVAKNQGEDYKMNVVLTDDITVNSGTVNVESTDARVWIGAVDGISSTSYQGTFDGNGKTVSGLYYDDTAENMGYVGLVPYVGTSGVVKNVTVINSYIRGGDGIGGTGAVVGVNNGTVTGCFSDATVATNTTITYIGGIVGLNGGTVELCGNTGSLSCNRLSDAGGVVGINSGIVRNCWNIGTLTGSNGYSTLGGIAAVQLPEEPGARIENCWSTGSISGGRRMGGIVGFAQGDGIVDNCYSNMAPIGEESEYEGKTPTVTDVMEKTADQFASGEVAYLLQGDQTTQVWGQNIDNGETVQTVPVFSDAKVYKNINCQQQISYSNTEDTNIHAPTHCQKEEPTCTEEGRIEYWYCELCETYFSDADCTTEATKLTIDPTGHHYDANGLCDNVNNGVVCGHVAPASVTLGSNAPVYYDTLQEAIDAVKECTAEDQAVVTVRKDIENTNGLAAKAEGGVFTLDIGEFDITGSNFAIQITNSTVTLTGTTGEVNKIYLLSSELMMEGGNVTCGEADLALMVNDSTLTVSGGTVGSSAENATAIYAANADSITVSGDAKIIGTNAVAISGTDTQITVTGGTVEAANDFTASEDSTIQAAISGGTFTDGITVSGTAGETLNDLLAEGYTYWQDGQQLDVAEDATSLEGTVEVKKACEHASITYTASGAQLHSDCDTCSAEADAQLIALGEAALVFDNSEKTVPATGAILGYEELPEVTYEGNRVNVGSFTAYLTAGDVSAQLTQEITPFLIGGVMKSRRVEKIYDGTTAGDFIVEKFFGPLAPARDEVYTLTAEFDSPDVGDRKLTVTLTLMDTEAAKNYDFGEPGGNSFSFVVDQEILPATVTVTGTTAQDKVYDGTANAVVTLGTVEGIVEGDDATVTATGVFADAASGADKTVTVTYAITGTDGGNYVLATDTEQLTASITARTAEEITEDVKDLTEDTVTSDDKDALEQAKEDLEEQLTDPSLTDEQKQQLQDALDKVEDLLDQIDDAVNAPDTDAVEDTMDTTADNVKPEQKEDIQQAIEDLKDALENFGDNYTDDQKQIVEDAIDRLEEALESIEKAEEVEDLLENLPETVDPDSETVEDILAAKDAYDSLTENEKSMIPEELVEKLEDLLEQITDYKLTKGDGAVWSEGDLELTANGPLAKFTELRIDDTVVAKANYTAVSGSTVITLKESYLATLSEGAHSIAVVYTDGEAVGSFTVKKAAAEPSDPSETTDPTTEATKPGTNGSAGTADEAPVMVWILLATVSLCGAAVLQLQDRRKRKF